MNDDVEQANVYEYLGMENDPLYDELKGLAVGQVIPIPDTTIEITKTIFGMYELASDECHECYNTPQSIYRVISCLLSDLLLTK